MSVTSLTLAHSPQISTFTQLRLSNASDAMATYAEQQMKISQDFYTQLFHSRKALLELQLWIVHLYLGF